MNLLITGAWQQAIEYISKIERKHAVLFLQHETDSLPCEPSWVEGVICNGLFLSHPIDLFTSLRYIQLTSAGFDRVPMDYVKRHKIKINNARGVYSIPMAEYALCGVLALYKKQYLFMKNKEEHKWIKDRNLQELNGKKVCILGCGSVGTECAKRFQAMGCVVCGIDPIVKKKSSFFHIYHTDDLRDVMKQSDIVIITLPLTDKTRHMFERELLSVIKDKAIIVNIARGELIDTSALIDELKSGRINAVLDVFEEEPISNDNDLWDLDNVIITPHNSFVGDGNRERLSNVIMKNIDAYCNDKVE